GMILAKTLFDDVAHGQRLSVADRHRGLASVHAVARAAHGLEVHGVDGERTARYRYVDLQTVPAEYAFMRFLAQRCELGCMQSEIGIGDMRMAGHAHELDGLAVRRLRTEHDSDIDAAG